MERLCCPITLVLFYLFLYFILFISEALRAQVALHRVCGCKIGQTRNLTQNNTFKNCQKHYEPIVEHNQKQKSAEKRDTLIHSMIRKTRYKLLKQQLN